MTAPRQVLAGTSYLVTRRCTQREFLLRPGEATNQLVGFLLAVAAQRFHVDVHAFCVMSNHLHLVVTDREARLPAFSQYLDSLVARSMNALLHRREHFWAPSSYSAVALHDPADLVAKVAYVLANPVTAGLVRRGRLWPGLWSPPERVAGAPLQFVRPAHFFRKKGKSALPEHASLPLVAPPGFDSPARFSLAVREALRAREELATADLAAHRRGFLGAPHVLAQPTSARPSHPEPLGQLNPRLACRDKWHRIQALAQLVEFLQAYRRAFAAWRSGAPALFPHGTYLMRVLHDAPCAAPA